MPQAPEMQAGTAASDCEKVASPAAASSTVPMRSLAPPAAAAAQAAAAGERRQSRRTEGRGRGGDDFASMRITDSTVNTPQDAPLDPTVPAPTSGDGGSGPDKQRQYQQRQGEHSVADQLEDEATE
eukprot:gene1053-22291_t